MCGLCEVSLEFPQIGEGVIVIGLRWVEFGGLGVCLKS